MSFFTSIFSNTASITRSTSASDSMSVDDSSRAIASSRLASLILPRFTAPPKFPVMKPTPLSSPSCEISIKRTAKPEVRAAVAMPDPIVPPPMTPIFAISRGVALPSGIFDTARSAKKAWRIPCDAGSFSPSMKLLRS